MVYLMPLRREVWHRRSPFRFRPRGGEPRCFLEQLAQHIVANKLAWWIALCVTVTATLALLPVFGVEVSLR